MALLQPNGSNTPVGLQRSFASCLPFLRFTTLFLRLEALMKEAWRIYLQVACRFTSVAEKVNVCGSDADGHNLGHRFKRFLAQSGAIIGQCYCQK